MKETDETQTITTVILWTNGMVACFNERGEQMPEYQGHYGEVKDKILQQFGREWQLAEWDKGVLTTFHPNVYLPLEGGKP